MDISVTQFRRRCLQLVREAEATRVGIAITRRGRVVARLEPIVAGRAACGKPWECMRGRGKWLAAPGETFVP